DREVYANHVSFIVPSADGFETSAMLNGEPIAAGVSTEVDEADYYELHVSRRDVALNVEEGELTRFIVRDTTRGNSEWGLPPWTPYPSVDSAAAEFTGAHIQIITPAEFPLGLEIPIIARVKGESGTRLGVNGTLKGPTPSAAELSILRGVGSLFLPAATEPGAVSWTGQIHGLRGSREITVEAATDWHEVSGGLTASVDWGENARIRIRGDADHPLTIAPGTTVTIGTGSVIVIDPDTTIVVEGAILVNGTAERPVVFTSEDRNVPWGGFLFELGGSQGDFTGAILTASGADPEWLNHHSGYGHSHRVEQCLFFLREAAQLTLTDCFIVENRGQAGHGERAHLTMTRCLVQKCITAGQYNHGSVVLNDCALIEFPSATAPFADDDNDALYLTGGAHALTDCLIGWALDDGIDAGSGAGGSVTVANCWFESCYHEAMAWSEARDADVTDSVILNCGQGIECGFGSPDVNAVRCLATANLVGARFGDNYDWTYDGFLSVSDSLLLFNTRDVWGQAWDDWTIHLAQMDVRNNYLSVPNANYPNNWRWDPRYQSHQIEQLEPFLPTHATAVGVALATEEHASDIADLPDAIRVRLSTFTIYSVSVDYAITSDTGYLDSGTLYFPAGETVKRIRLDALPLEGVGEIHVALSHPVNAELTGLSGMTYYNPAAFIEPLIVTSDVWAYLKGTAEPPADWTALSFDDAGWLSGATPIGYEAGSGYETHLATDLSDMQNNYISVYARREFVVDDPNRLTGLTLTVDFDDGYLAYLNGVAVANANAPNPTAYGQPAGASHEACAGTCDPEPIDLTEHIEILRRGRNVLALEVHNRSLASSDFLFTPQLSASTAP
ncbi:MAG: hypothetical protein JSW27_20535, partial [Phycisphaerales bacterium]